MRANPCQKNVTKMHFHWWTIKCRHSFRNHIQKFQNLVSAKIFLFGIPLQGKHYLKPNMLLWTSLCQISSCSQQSDCAEKSLKNDSGQPAAKWAKHWWYRPTGNEFNRFLICIALSSAINSAIAATFHPNLSDACGSPKCSSESTKCCSKSNSSLRETACPSTNVKQGTHMYL